MSNEFENSVYGFSLPEWECSLHGNIGTARVQFNFPNGEMKGPYCMVCIIDALERAGIRKVTQVASEHAKSGVE
jgi:hypothetical protein